MYKEIKQWKYKICALKLQNIPEKVWWVPEEKVGWGSSEG